jgi:hypothetical protein
VHHYPESLLIDSWIFSTHNRCLVTKRVPLEQPPHPRASVKLSPPILHQLNLYALGATVAGVGVLALVHPAEGKIIYTKTHKWIGVKHSVLLDLNHDGKTDFSLYQTQRITSASFWTLEVIPSDRMRLSKQARMVSPITLRPYSVES